MKLHRICETTLMPSHGQARGPDSRFRHLPDPPLPDQVRTVGCQLQNPPDHTLHLHDASGHTTGRPRCNSNAGVVADACDPFVFVVGEICELEHERAHSSARSRAGSGRSSRQDDDVIRAPTDQARSSSTIRTFNRKSGSSLHAESLPRDCPHTPSIRRLESSS